MASAAVPTWQQTCTAALLDAVQAGERAGPEQWVNFITNAERANRVIIADASFDDKSLRGFDLSRTYFARVTFLRANLSNTDFQQSIFRKCDASDANIEGAKFRGADLHGDGLILSGALFNEETDFEVERSRLPDELAPGLRGVADRAKFARRWRQRKSYSPAAQGMLFLTRHGYSLGPLIWVGLFVAALFSLLFWLAGSTSDTAILASIGYFIGINSIYTSGLLLGIGLAEGIVGAIFFAVFTAILVSLFFDKN